MASEDPTERPKRERKQVEKFKVAEAPTPSKFVVEPGSGIPLQNFPFFVKGLEGHGADSDVAKMLHHVIFGNLGKKIDRKKQIRCFSGFAPGVKDERLAKILENKKKWTVALLKECLSLVGVSQVGTREEIAAKLTDYLDSPTVTKSDGSTKTVGGKGQKRKASSSAKGAKGKSARKKSKTGYNLFAKAKSAELKKTNKGTLSFTEMTQFVSAAWKEVDEEEKIEWSKKAAEFNARAEEEKAEEEKAAEKESEEEEEEEGEEEEGEEEEDADADILGEGEEKGAAEGGGSGSDV